MMKQILQPPITYKSLDVFKSKDFWDDFFFRIGNGESLRGAAKDLGVPFQTVWSSIMIDEAEELFMRMPRFLVLTTTLPR